MVSVILQWNQIDFLYDRIQFFCMFNATRVDFFLVLFMFLALAASLKVIGEALNYNLASKVLFTLLFVAFFVKGIFLKKEMEVAFRGEVTYNQYVATDLFDKIDADINFKSREFFVVGINIDPSTMQVNGARTLDVYTNNYTLSHKQAFEKIVEEEYKVYNDLPDIGNRCYIYYGDEPENGEIFIRLNTDQLKKLNCKYILSKYTLENYQDLNLKLFKSYPAPDTYWENVHVYQVF